MKRFWKAGMVIVAALVTMSVARTASADAVNGCTVSNVTVWGAYNGGNAPTIPALRVNCNGTFYYANQYVPAQFGSCPGWSADIVKLWETLASTALLSGKHLNVNYSPSNGSCGTPTITQIDLVP